MPEKRTTYTSSGYINAQDETPASEPHMNGTTEAWTGIQTGVGPCSPEGSRPMI